MRQKGTHECMLYYAKCVTSIQDTKKKLMWLFAIMTKYVSSYSYICTYRHTDRPHSVKQPLCFVHVQSQWSSGETSVTTQPPVLVHLSCHSTERSGQNCYKVKQETVLRTEMLTGKILEKGTAMSGGMLQKVTWRPVMRFWWWWLLPSRRGFREGWWLVLADSLIAVESNSSCTDLTALSAGEGLGCGWWGDAARSLCLLCLSFAA